MSSPEHRLPFLLGLVLAFAPLLLAAAPPRPGEPFPVLAAEGLEGDLPVLSGRVVMVDFWATWCAPCKSSFPHYSELQRELGPRGFTLVGVSVDKKAAPYAEFLRRQSPAFATVRDAEQKLAAAISPPAMPTCYLIDRQGVLRFVHAGFHGEEDVRRLRAEIEQLLQESP